MHLYKAFGICIESEILLPQFTSADGQKPELSIRYCNAKEVLPIEKGEERATQLSEHEIGFYFHQVGSYLVKNGREVIIEPYPAAEDQLIRLPLIGIAMAAVLQ